MTDDTNYFEEQIIKWLCDGTQMPTPPGTLYVALHSSDPGETPDGSTEISAGGYSRQSIAASDLSGTGSQRDNDIDLVFGPATEDWGDVSHVSIWDGSADTDNALQSSQLDATRTVLDGDEFRLKSGDLNFERR